MGRSSIKYINTPYMRDGSAEKKPVLSPVVYGRFPKADNEKPAVEKINKFLCFMLLVFAMLSLVSYYFVSDDEKNMNRLGREILSLNSENMELQNKLDNMNSFNKIDTIISRGIGLDTAHKVLEVNSGNIAYIPELQPSSVNYNWSIGY